MRLVERVDQRFDVPCRETPPDVICSGSARSPAGAERGARRLVVAGKLTTLKAHPTAEDNVCPIRHLVGFVI